MNNSGFYIDTRTKEKMRKSICDYLNIAEKDLNDLFDNAYNYSIDGILVDGVKRDEVINKFIDIHQKDRRINNVLFYHLSRRLNAYNEKEPVLNLFELLSTENSMSSFLKMHNIYFMKNDQSLDLYYAGEIMSLEDTSEVDVAYLRWRLGHNSRIDYCINGFLLKDRVYKNTYATSLYRAPEFIATLSRFLKKYDLINDYTSKSKYYCYEYSIPISKVMFDNYEELSDYEKEKYLLLQILLRLYNYYHSDPRYLYDHDPVIRLNDIQNIENEFFVSKEEITLDLLR